MFEWGKLRDIIEGFGLKLTALVRKLHSRIVVSSECEYSTSLTKFRAERRCHLRIDFIGF